MAYIDELRLNIFTNKLFQLQGIMKAPPGPPPWDGLVWWEPTKRWRNPDKWRDDPKQSSARMDMSHLMPYYDDLRRIINTHPNVIQAKASSDDKSSLMSLNRNLKTIKDDIETGNASPYQLLDNWHNVLDSMDNVTNNIDISSTIPYFKDFEDALFSTKIDDEDEKKINTSAFPVSDNTQNSINSMIENHINDNFIYMINNHIETYKDDLPYDYEDHVDQVYAYVDYFKDSAKEGHIFDLREMTTNLSEALYNFNSEIGEYDPEVADKISNVDTALEGLQSQLSEDLSNYVNSDTNPLGNLRLSSDFSMSTGQAISSMASENIYKPRNTPTYVNSNRSLSVGKYQRSDAVYRINKKLGIPVDKPVIEPEDPYYTDDKILEELLDTMNPIERPQMLYRGVNKRILNDDGENVKEGDLLTNKAFFSSSRNHMKAYRFSTSYQAEAGDDYYPSMIEVVTTENTPAITLSDADSGLMESETILKPGLKMKVHKIYEDVMMPSNYDVSPVKQYIVASFVDEDSQELNKSMDVEKEAPGPPPWEGLVWWEPTKRWRNPDNWRDNPSYNKLNIDTMYLQGHHRNLKNTIDAEYEEFNENDDYDVDLDDAFTDLMWMVNDMSYIFDDEDNLASPYEILDRWHDVLDTFSELDKQDKWDTSYILNDIKRFENHLFNSKMEDPRFGVNIDNFPYDVRPDNDPRANTHRDLVSDSAEYSPKLFNLDYVQESFDRAKEEVGRIEDYDFLSSIDMYDPYMYADEEQIESLKEYISTEHEYYAELNHALRYELNLTPDQQNDMENIQELMQPLEELQILYRGMETYVFNDDGAIAQVGDIITNKSFMSTSRDPEVASGFSNGTTFIEVIPDPTTKGITLTNNDESETLINLGHKFKVLSIYDKPDWVGDYRDLRQFIRIQFLPEEDSQELNKSLDIQKAPPGPPPWEGLVWYEPTKRWRNPENWRENEHKRSIMADISGLRDIHRELREHLSNKIDSLPLTSNEEARVIDLYNSLSDTDLGYVSIKYMSPYELLDKWHNVLDDFHIATQSTDMSDTLPIIQEFENQLFALEFDQTVPEETPPRDGMVYNEEKNRWDVPDNWDDNKELENVKIRVTDELKSKYYSMTNHINESIRHTDDENIKQGLRNMNVASVYMPILLEGKEASPYELLYSWNAVQDAWNEMSSDDDEGLLRFMIEDDMKWINNHLLTKKPIDAREYDSSRDKSTDKYDPRLLNLDDLPNSMGYSNQQAENFNPTTKKSYVGMDFGAEEGTSLYSVMEYMDVDVNNFEIINDSMRGIKEITPEVQEDIENIQLYMVPLEESQVLYRGLDHDLLDDETGQRAKEGDIITTKSFMSTSRDIGDAESFSGYNTFIEVIPHPTTLGITTDSDENETIINSGEPFRVDMIERNIKWPTRRWGRRTLSTFMRISMLPKDHDVEKSLTIQKEAPGPPPWEGLVWWEPTKRWRNPDNWIENNDIKHQSFLTENLANPIDNVLGSLNTIRDLYTEQHPHIQNEVQEFFRPIGSKLGSMAHDIMENPVVSAHEMLDKWHDILTMYDFIDNSSSVDASSMLPSMQEFEREMFKLPVFDGRIYHPSDSEFNYGEPREQRLLHYSDMEGSLNYASEMLESFNYRDEPTFFDESEQSEVSNSIGIYTWGSESVDHHEINDAMKSGKITPEIQQHIENIQSIMKPMEHERIVYRGIPISNEQFLNDEGQPVQIGDEITLKSFTSTSRNYQEGIGFSRMNVFMEIITDKSTEAVTLGVDEHETILNSGQKLRIDDIVPDLEWPINEMYQRMYGGRWMNMTVRATMLPNEPAGETPWGGLEYDRHNKVLRSPEGWYQDPEYSNALMNPDSLLMPMSDIMRSVNSLRDNIRKYHDDETFNRFLNFQSNVQALDMRVASKDNPYKILDYFNMVKDNLRTSQLPNTKRLENNFTEFQDKLFTAPFISGSDVPDGTYDIGSGGSTQSMIDTEDLVNSAFRAHHNGENYNEKSADNYMRVSDNIHVKNYTLHDSAPINQFLWGDMENIEDYQEGIMEQIEGISDAMKPFGNTPQTLYRGIPEQILNDDGDAAEEGQIITLKGFTSTSRDPILAQALSGGVSFVEVLTDKDTLGITLSNDDTQFEEDETLLNFGQKFYVEKRETNLNWENKWTNLQNYYVLRAVDDKAEVEKSLRIMKAPPGPPPWHGLVWNEPTHRWRNPDNWRDDPTLADNKLPEGLLSEVGAKLYSEIAEKFDNIHDNRSMEIMTDAMDNAMYIAGTNSPYEALEHLHSLEEKLEEVNDTHDSENLLNRVQELETILFEAGGGKKEGSEEGFSDKLIDINDLQSSYNNARDNRTKFIGNEPTFLDHQFGRDYYADIGDTMAIKDYTKVAYYAVNKHLRGEDIDNTYFTTEKRAKWIIGNMTALMAPMEKPMTLFRGMKDDLLNDVGSTARVGDVIDHKGFVSTSRDPDVASTFARNNVFMEIRTHESTRAMTLDTNEEETILDTSQKIKVDEIHKNVNWPYRGVQGNRMGTYIVVSVMPNE